MVASKSTYVESRMPPERLLAQWREKSQQAGINRLELLEAPKWPVGGGETGELIRMFDWSATPMGPLAGWPQSRRSVVDLMLSSAQPAYIALGTQHISLYNDGYIPILGDKHPRALGQPYRELWSELWDEYEPHIHAVMAGQAQVRQDEPTQLTGRPGRPTSWFSFSLTPIRDEAGTVAGFFVFAIETTDRVLSERELVQSMDEGFALLEIDFAADGTPGDWRYVQTNAAFEAQSGLQGAVGRSVREMVPDIEPYWIEKFGRVVSTGEPSRFVAEVASLKKWFNVYAFHYGGEDSNRVAVLFRDITARHYAEQEFQRNQQRAVAALSIAKLGIYELNLRTDRMQCSQRVREIFGFSPEQGCTAADYFGRIVPEDIARVRHEFAEAMAGDGRLHVAYRIRLPDGNVRAIDSMNASYRDERGEWERREGVIKDVTERRLNEEKQEEESRRKDEFLAMLAHELRNPLAPISAAAALLQTAADDEIRVKSAGAVISRQVRHLTGLVDDLLDVSRVTRGQVTLERSCLDVRRLVSEAVEQVRPVIDARHHSLSLETCSEPAIVDADMTRLVQVLVNLLTNAAKYTPLGGHITLAVESDDEVRITVTDDGQGMSPDLLQRCFDLFVQAERSADRRQGGLGVGLALAKSLVELHGGSVRAHSGGPGQGSRFTVTLPRAAGKQDFTERATLHLASAMRERRKVLILDDNKDAAETLGMLLESIGHEVMVEFEPSVALERIRKEAPDICLVDIGLPEMDGYEWARAVRATSIGQSIVLIAVTGYSQAEDRAKALSAGFDDHLVKPVDVSRLVELLNGQPQSERH
jgi:signal transduction histidine kinase/ActR/RegA family two-component response regulator